MPSETTAIAERFVDLVFKYRELWKEVGTLSPDYVQILFETVSAAGFKPAMVIPGKLVGQYHDQEGATGKTYRINSLCPYKVVGPDNKDHYHATGWLDRALQLALRGTDRQERTESIRNEIERSVPLTPIQLTEEGDLLREYPPSGDYFVDHTRDNHELGHSVGVHDTCNGWIDRIATTKTQDALVCRKCHLRVLFPNGIRTYGELRQLLADKLSQVVA